jgi:peptide/nickel transport system ATP-binding protein
LSEAIRQHPDFKRAPKQVVQKQCLELLDLVGLSSESLQKYSHEFSGGQCQRIGIARSLAVQPKFIVCDEVVSALDVSVQAQILNLLKDLQKERNLSYLFITHDLGVVRYLCDSVVVLEKGKVVEQNQTELLFENPEQIYTQNLLKAVPRL